VLLCCQYTKDPWHGAARGEDHAGVGEHAVCGATAVVAVDGERSFIAPVAIHIAIHDVCEAGVDSDPAGKASSASSARPPYRLAAGSAA